VKHLVEVADLEHQNMLWLRQLQLLPLLDKATVRGLAVFAKAAADI
jgi:hypothetical protein